jgi:hypothetical protein
MKPEPDPSPKKSGPTHLLVLWQCDQIGRNFAIGEKLFQFLTMRATFLSFYWGGGS